jgi:4-amino-4-deoxy-L-arabinose transferase-like glycosyltransferase
MRAQVPLGVAFAPLPLVIILASLALSSCSAWRGAPGIDCGSLGCCLPPAAGDTIATLVNAGELVPLAPPSWRLVSANIDRQQLTLSYATRGDEMLGLRLVSARQGAGEPAGRWFFMEPFSSVSAGLAPESRDALLRVGRRVDEAFTSTPWTTCARDERLAKNVARFVRWGLVGMLGVWLAALVRLLVRRAPAVAKRLARWWPASRLRHACLVLPGLFEQGSPWPLFAVLVPLAAVLQAHLDVPFDADYATQRIFSASLDWLDIVRHQIPDARHPQLFFLVLHLFEQLGRDEWLMRLPAVLFALTTVAALYAFAKPLIGAPRALLAAALLAMAQPFVLHARDVGNETLFLTLALLASHYLLRNLEAPRSRSLLLYALAAIGMVYSNYMALAVGFAHALVMLRHGRARRYLGLWLVCGAVALAALPALSDLSLAAHGDLPARALADLYPQHFWGANEPLRFARAVVLLMLPPGWLAWVASALVVAGVGAWAGRFAKRPESTFLFGLALAAMAVCASVSWLRIKDYYLIILLPFTIVLMTAGGLSLPALATASSDDVPRARALARALRRFAPLLRRLAFLVVLVGSGLGAAAYLPTLYERGSRAQYEQLAVQVAAEGGADLVIGDPEYLHTILLYYLFPNAAEMYRSCLLLYSELGVRCALGGRRLETLTRTTAMPAGWGQVSLMRLHIVAEVPYWFVYLTKFENPELRRFLNERCQVRGTWEPLVLYRCPPAS